MEHLQHPPDQPSPIPRRNHLRYPHLLFTRNQRRDPRIHRTLRSHSRATNPRPQTVLDALVSGNPHNNTVFDSVSTVLFRVCGLWETWG